MNGETKPWVAVMHQSLLSAFPYRSDVHQAKPGESAHAIGLMIGTREVQETRPEGANAPVVLCRSDGSAITRQIGKTNDFTYLAGDTQR